VVEQNRDAQLRSLLMIENHAPGEKLVAVLNFDGMPLTARFVADSIRNVVRPAKAQKAKVIPIRKVPARNAAKKPAKKTASKKAVTKNSRAKPSKARK